MPAGADATTKTFAMDADEVAFAIRLSAPAGECLRTNAGWTERTGQDEGAAQGWGWLACVHPEDLDPVRAAYRQASPTTPVAVEYRLRTAAGLWQPVFERARPRIADGIMIGHVSAAVERSGAGVQDTETLLLELAHRVKNNAQATTSFLGLQANRASDPRVAAALRAAAQRVMLATLVQDRMFRIGPEARVDLGAELARTAQSAVEVAGRPGLHLHTEVEPGITAPVTLAMPLALVVNELAVNAARHAFPERPQGRIRLQVRRTPPDGIEIVIADDGVGLPSPMQRDTAHGALGLHLVPRLARQSGAQFRIESNGGTRASLQLRLAS